MSKELAAKAERAAEWWLHSLGCVRTVRAVRTRYQRQDLFACDVLGLHAEGRWIGVQVTTGGNTSVRPRRRKLEALPWSIDDDVYLCELRVSPDPANRRRQVYHFRVHELRVAARLRTLGGIVGDGGSLWEVWPEAVDVPREWLRAMPR